MYVHNSYSASMKQADNIPWESNQMDLHNSSKKKINMNLDKQISDNK